MLGISMSASASVTGRNAEVPSALDAIEFLAQCTLGAACFNAGAPQLVYNESEKQQASSNKGLADEANNASGSEIHRPLR